MNTVSPLALTRLTPTALANAGTMLCDHVAPLKAEPFIARQVAAITAALSMKIEIANTLRSSDRTESIVELDGEIDELLPIVIDDLEACVRKAKRNQARADAAKTLLDLVNKRDRRKLLHGGYVDQGDEIATLFGDIMKPELKPLRELTDVEQPLVEIQDLFGKLTVLLKERQAEGNLPTTQKEQRQVLRYRIDKLLSYIDANIADNVKGYAAIKPGVNGLITDIMAQAAAAKTRKESAEAPAIITE